MSDRLFDVHPPSFSGLPRASSRAGFADFAVAVSDRQRKWDEWPPNKLVRGDPHKLEQNMDRRINEPLDNWRKDPEHFPINKEEALARYVSHLENIKDDL